MNTRILKLLTTALLLVFLVSCGKNDNYDQSMQKTKEAIIEKKFEQAEGFIELALEDRPKEDEAKNYQKQLELYQKGLQQKADNEINGAKKMFNKLIEIKGGSDKLVSYAKEELKNLETDNETKTTDSSEQKKSIWNETKSNDLKTFMAGFSQSMGQQYEEYSTSNSVDLYGVQIPGDILDGDWSMAVNDQAVQVEWSETGEGSASYQLVAVYSDADTQPYLEKHVYFFIIENGTPKVYVTQQNQGNDQNYLYFSETQNPDLPNAFSEIMAGKSVATPVSNKSNDFSLDEESVRNLDFLKGSYVNASTNSPTFSIDDSYYNDLVSGKKYRITSIGREEKNHTEYTIAWDIDEFAATYGQDSVGPGPQPFIYTLHVGIQGNGFTLVDLSNQSFRKE